MSKIEEIRRLQEDANVAKERLMQIAWELEEIGAIQKSKSLETIIAHLEMWQNK